MGSYQDPAGKRPQGRPAKLRKGEGGRDLLLEAVRRLLRSSPTLANQRTEVARAAGVTPALLCYYFPDHAGMLECATQPVVEGYMRELTAILRGQDHRDAKLHAVVTLLLRVNMCDPHIVDCYVDLVRRKSGGEEQVAALLEGYQELTDFLASTPASEAEEPGFFVFALWGMCRTLAQQAALPVDVRDGDDPAQREQRLADFVFGLVAGRSAVPWSPPIRHSRFAPGPASDGSGA